MSMLVCTALIVALVAWRSRLNSFPDENLHVTTASYYLDHWVPPGMDRELAAYAGVHGVSYFMLWPPQASYVVAGKLAAILPFEPWVVYRAFCVALWAFLLWMVVPRLGRQPGLFLLVGLTPQVWYVFTYFSADALSYCAAACVVVLIAVPDSSARRFIETGKPWLGAISLGVAAGVLALSKMNYMTFALVAVVYCGIILYRLRTVPGAWMRAALCFVIATIVAGPFLILDVARNGVERGARFEALREELAAPGFKPTDIEAGTAYRGLALKHRGVSAKAMFSRPWRWGLLTSRSFFGVYGTMDVFSPPGCNGIQRLATLAFIVLAILRRRKLDPIQRGFLIVSVAMVVVAIAAAFWRAWTFDFQAQGRYLFAIIPIVALLTGETSELRNEPLQWAVSAVLLVAGAVSILAALPQLA